MKIIDIVPLKQQLREALQARIQRRYTLGIILASDDFASAKYVSMKQKFCEEIGVSVVIQKFPATVSTEEVCALIDTWNEDPRFHGILVQLPLFLHLPEDLIINRIHPHKDVDGLTVHSFGALFSGKKVVTAATAVGVMKLLAYLELPLRGKNVGIVGRGKLVAKPLIQLLLDQDATVHVFHSKSVDLSRQLPLMDIVITCVGKAKIFGRQFFRDGQILIDVGTSDYRGKISGDLDLDDLSELDVVATKVPGGVGGLTIVSLVENLVILGDRYGSF